MYYDIRDIYWWKELKRDIADFVTKRPNCKQLKAGCKQLNTPMISES